MVAAGQIRPPAALVLRPPPLPEICPRVSGAPSGCFSPCRPASLHHGGLPLTSGFGPVAAPLQFPDGAAQLLYCECCCRPGCRRSRFGRAGMPGYGPAAALLLSPGGAAQLLCCVAAAGRGAGTVFSGGPAPCWPGLCVSGSCRWVDSSPAASASELWCWLWFGGAEVMWSIPATTVCRPGGVVGACDHAGLLPPLLRPGVPGPASSSVHGSTGVLYWCGFGPATR